MTHQVVAYLAAAVIFTAIDLLWLSFAAPRFYLPTIGDIARSPVNLPGAIVFYAIYPVGLVIFAISPALAGGSLAAAVLKGALFGFFTYATYDLTNLATLRNWTWGLTALDVAWGTTLAGAAAGAAYAITARFFPSV